MVPQLMAIGLVTEITHSSMWTFAPVTYPILDVVEITVLWVVSHPSSQRWITVPKPAVGTVGVYVAILVFGVESALHYVL